MSQANELLDNLTEEIVEPAGEAGTTPEERHIIIGRDRFITVPEELKKIAVQFDHDIETVTFDCPRYWDGNDMSKMKVYVNYVRADGKPGTCLCTNVVVDETDSELMHFDWTISGNVTFAAGGLVFLVCIKRTDSDGNEENHWNSELCSDTYVSQGLRCMDLILRRYPDIITQLLERMDDVEDKTTEEAMLGYLNKYLLEGTAMKSIIASYVYEYMTENDAFRFVIGPHNPVKECLWFNTAGDNNTEGGEFVVSSTKPEYESLWFNELTEVEGDDDPSVFRLNNNTDGATVFAEIDETTYGVDNATIGKKATENNYNFEIL